MYKRLEARVYGYVQGVGYRYFIRYWARSLSLNGYARNDPEGTVSVVLEGPEEKLKKVLEHMRAGPPASRVSNVQYRFLEAQQEFSEFEIK